MKPDGNAIPMTNPPPKTLPNRSKQVTLKKLVHEAYKNGFSDIHLGVGRAPCFRNQGRIMKTSCQDILQCPCPHPAQCTPLSAKSARFRTIFRSGSSWKKGKYIPSSPPFFFSDPFAYIYSVYVPVQSQILSLNSS